MKPTVPEVLPLVWELYARHAAGCCLHIVLDDGNVEDESVQYCLDNAEHDECRELAEILLKMSPTQRRKLSSRAYDGERAKRGTESRGGWLTVTAVHRWPR